MAKIEKSSIEMLLEKLVKDINISKYWVANRLNIVIWKIFNYFLIQFLELSICDLRQKKIHIHFILLKFVEQF